MRVRIRLDDQAQCLIGRTVRLDGQPMGRVTGPELAFDVNPGWHLLEVLDIRHQTRPLRFLAGTKRDVEAEVRPAHPQYLDYSWFELVPA